MDDTTESSELVTTFGIPMLRGSIPTVQMVVATLALGLLILVVSVR